MAWTAPSDHAASVVSVAEWNNFHGTAGNCAYLKAIADAPMKAQKDGGAVVGGRQALNFVSGANMTITVADDAGNNQVDVTLAASGGSLPTAWETSGASQTYTTSSTQGAFGSYDEAIASTAAAVIYMILSVTQAGHGAGRVRVGVGPGGSEAEELTLAYLSAGIYTFSFPVSIASGSRIAVCGANDTDAVADAVSYSLTVGE
jgi:hypothetical protein